MKFVYPDINHVFETDGQEVNCLIIENQKLLYDMLMDFREQLSGNDGRCVLSDCEKTLSIEKNAELITNYIPFEINRKNLLTKTVAKMESIAISDEFYGEGMELLSKIESYLSKLSFQMDCDLTYDKISIGSLIKASGVQYQDEYDSLAEKLIDYFELVTDLDRSKFFVVLNIRSFIDDAEAQRFIDTIISHQYHVLMIESSERPRLVHEARFIVDADLCEIS